MAAVGVATVAVGVALAIVCVTAALVLYELATRLRADGAAPPLPQQRCADLTLQWLAAESRSSRMLAHEALKVAGLLPPPPAPRPFFADRPRQD